ncbi:sugar ABC transporter ATP-binding protein [Alicyclobacillus contaminans]|uniref:sugar ABC transporter ATP-binding protein n=1 Tax=Alicyclobacillus contaminans TaxID=392016 RepID=UPI000553D2FD|nr:sugar ABC transporter ATP-binding protein [Alicyclobacillus contaminans]
MESPILAMHGISKTFPGVHALKNVDLEFRKGEVHALVGANGAGKSTVVKILSGSIAKDAGQMEFEGKAVEITSPEDAEALGIATVYQEVDTVLVPTLSVAENLFLRATGPRWIRWSKLYDTAKQWMAVVGWHGNVRTPVHMLSLAEKQLIVIARALGRQAKVLILDEPTASLGTAEAEALHTMLRHLRDAGLTVLYISHRLNEVFALADRLTVMRDGQRVFTLDVAGTPPAELHQRVVQGMLSESLAAYYPKTPVPPGEVLLEVENLRAPGVHGVSFAVRAGEILGITGLVGAGKTELAHALYGVTQPLAGTIRLGGVARQICHPHQAVQLGMYMIPEERRQQGVFVDESCTVNLSITDDSRWVRKARVKALARDLAEQVRLVTSSLDKPVRWLSGGNQQKVSLGKWIGLKGQVFIFDEPTKGIDVGAKTEIYRLMTALAKRGAAILLISSEIEEVLGMSDRLLVLYQGTVAAEYNADVSEHEVLKMATGGGYLRVGEH